MFPFPGIPVESELQVVRIYFNTALYDEIVRDKDGKMPIHQVDSNSCFSVEKGMVNFKTERINQLFSAGWISGRHNGSPHWLFSSERS